MAAVVTRLLAAVLMPAAATAAGFDHTHAALTAVLRDHVQDGRVNYAALRRAGPGRLDWYLGSLETVSRADFDRWTEPQRLAFLINAYNGWTLQLVVDHYPVASIKRIGGWLSSPWKVPVVRLWGRTLTLDDLEHGMLRKSYAEPRIHFALVCAAVSCPELRSEAYRAADLDRQLDDQGRRFLADRTKNRFDPAAKRAELSPIFKWFEEDFGRDEPALLSFLSRFAPVAAAAGLREPGWSVSYLPYDWSLNDHTGIPGGHHERVL